MATASDIILLIYIRTRFGEDLLRATIKEGLDQYVIVGAGYDRFSVRRPDLMKKIILYELDQPATQQSKRKRMKAAGLTEPENVCYVASNLRKRWKTPIQANNKKEKAELCN